MRLQRIHSKRYKFTRYARLRLSYALHRRKITACRFFHRIADICIVLIHSNVQWSGFGLRVSIVTDATYITAILVNYVVPGSLSFLYRRISMFI